MTETPRKTMQDIIRRHTLDDKYNFTHSCDCGVQVIDPEDDWVQGALQEAHANHVVAIMAEHGYGDLRDSPYVH